MVKGSINGEEHEISKNINIINDFSNQLDDGNQIGLMLNIYHHMADAIIVFDGQGTIIDANPAFCNRLNLTKMNIVGKSIESIIPSEKSYKISKQINILKYKNEVRGILPIQVNKDIVYFEFTTSPLHNREQYVSILRDVTEKRLLEQKIKTNGELYKDLFVEALDAIVFWCNDGTIVDANESACRVFESTLEQLKKRKWTDFVFSKDYKYTQMTKQLERNGSIREELLFLMPNDQKKFLEFTSKLHAVDGNHMTIFRNVTERYQMEQELRESERKFRKIFEGALEGIVLWDDTNSTIIDINPAGELILGVQKEEAVGKTLSSLLISSPVTKKKFYEEMSLLRDEGTLERVLSYVLPSGKRKHLEVALKHNVFSNVSLTTFRDITEKLEMEEQLRKSDTLNVIGQLAAGIAHEIRNPMTALKGFIQLLEDTIREDNSMYFNVITTELNRIESIINEFLILAKPQAVKYVEVDLRQILRETVELLTGQAVLHNVQFDLFLENKIPSLYCEPNQLKKVFINIIKNAIEVMTAGGVISIDINVTEDQRIHISIRDEGGGIPKDKVKKLGEPFYTTKERGTGLGLMVTFKIIEEHSGTIEVESEVGKGTVFHIYLPLKRNVKKI